MLKIWKFLVADLEHQDQSHTQWSSNRNKSNSTAEAVRVEAYLSGTSAAIAQFLLQMHNKKMVIVESEGQGDEA